MTIRSSTFSPVYNTNPETNNLLVEIAGESQSTTNQVYIPIFRTVNNSGTISSGATSVAIANAGGAVGTINGINVPIGVSLSWDAPIGGVLSSISYNATNTTFIITEVRQDNG